MACRPPHCHSVRGGRLFVVVPAGNHRSCWMVGSRRVRRCSWSCRFLPRRVRAHVEGWELAGVHEDGVADSNLQLSRIEKNRSEGPRSFQPGRCRRWFASNARS